MKLSIVNKRHAFDIPNDSSSFDEARNRICLWLYDVRHQNIWDA